MELQKSKNIKVIAGKDTLDRREYWKFETQTQPGVTEGGKRGLYVEGLATGEGSRQAG